MTILWPSDPDYEFCHRVLRLYIQCVTLLWPSNPDYELFHQVLRLFYPFQVDPVCDMFTSFFHLRHAAEHLLVKDILQDIIHLSIIHMYPIFSFSWDEIVCDFRLFHDRILSTSDWSRGVEVHPGGVVIIPEVKDQHSGRYTCMAVTSGDLAEQSMWIDLTEPCSLGMVIFLKYTNIF